jgi:hypothetical protein
MAAAAEMTQTVITTFICPSRRAVRLYPMGASGAQPWNAGPILELSVSRSDYAVSCGSEASCQPGRGGPTSYENAMSYAWPDYSSPTSADFQAGVSFVRSQVTPPQVEKGTAHIIMLGEKCMDANHYTDGGDYGDNETLFVGQDNDIYRTTNSGQPVQDLPGIRNSYDYFGSAHAGGCNFAAGDASVHTISYDVDSAVYTAYGCIDSLVQGSPWDE